LKQADTLQHRHSLMRAQMQWLRIIVAFHSLRILNLVNGNTRQLCFAKEVKNMTGKVDDVWASLKAQSASRSRQKPALPSVQPISNPRSGSSHVNVADGPAAPPEMQAMLSEVQRKAVPISTQDEDAAAFLAPLQRDINSLTAPDRTTRLQAVRKIQSALISSLTPPSGQLLQSAVQGALHRNLIAMLADPVEACREAALCIMTHVARTVPDFSPLLPPTLVALKQRMGVGRPVPLESSEEARLAIVKLVSSVLVSLPGDTPSAFADDLVAMLVCAIEDPYHEMKKAGFSGATELVQHVPVGALEPSLPKLLEPLSQAFHHPHSRVRSAATDTLSHLLQRTPASDELLAKHVVPSLRTAVMDRSTSVRDAAFCATGAWLGAPDGSGSTCPAARPQRYMPQLLPVLLLGVTDSSAEVAAHALKMVESVGEHFCNQVLDNNVSGPASADAPEADASSAAAVSLPAPFTERASQPARRMVQSQLPAILPPVLKEMREWTVALRLNASRSVYAAAAFAEAALLPHLPVLLPALCNAVGDQDEAIALRVVSTAQIVGAFCEVCPLPCDSASSRSVSCTAACCHAHWQSARHDYATLQSSSLPRHFAALNQ
jgi:hypothetical protein